MIFDKLIVMKSNLLREHMEAFGKNHSRFSTCYDHPNSFLLTKMYMISPILFHTIILMSYKIIWFTVNDDVDDDDDGDDDDGDHNDD